ncbi:Conserved_hypothetical protein [Hexamita inflata]|uniref:Uncharacterized protein n=1 Tax=Hexamita inflata TaxID=28002 RepID=A0AA86VSC6_9EUKA|nr:Conserved hypothetical protein [Hexamita inflata]
MQCFSNILVNNNNYNYCQKLTSLNNLNVNDNIFFTQKANNINLFIYTNVTQQSQIDVTVKNIQVNTFSLFGFSLNSQTIIDSDINVSIQFQVLTGALLCITCNLDVQRCNLVFIASGQQISGMIIEPIESFKIQQSFIQFRISSMNSSGLTNVITASVTFIISQCKLTGSNLVYSSYNGYIASAILVHISLNITQFDICVDSTSRFGQNSVSISITGSETVWCDICEEFVVYGLCSEALKYSENVNGMQLCVYPFEYVDNQCVCVTGYLLNNIECINVVEAINIISNKISNNSYSNDQIQLLSDQIENSITDIEQSISSNIQDIENKILSNFSKSDFNLLINTSILDKRIHQNITSVKNDILTNQIIADVNLGTNTTILDWRIFNNVSMLNAILNTSLLNFTIQINTLEQQVGTIKNEQDAIAQSILSNMTEIDDRILSNFSKADENLALNTSVLDNRIYQNISSVKNDILTSYVNLDTNTTVLDWRIFNNVSQLQNIMNKFNDSLTQQQKIIEQQQHIIYNLTQQINCSNNFGYSMVNGSCVQVSCVISGQQSINGICQCVNINSIVQAGSCVCPVNSQLVGIACVCNISGQTMQNGQCTCSKIGQNIINGTCQCPIGQSVVNDSCKQVISNSYFECSQEIFTQQFDIQSITSQITTSSNFSTGYVFGASTTIQNAFIDISDNVYTTTVYPLFQSQNSFMNIKIQFGTQSLNSGSLLLSSPSVSINQMNIISKSGYQLAVNAAQQLSILTASSNNTYITKLLINLSFTPSSGNITLMNNINGLLNITGYQVLGTYISTGSVSMIGLSINSANMNINKVNFQLNAFNVGNGSSYLFGNVSASNAMEINNFSVILGSSANFLLLGSISTSTSNYYLFGGIIAYINSSSSVNVNNIIFDQYQKFITSYVTYSGVLLGCNIYSNSSSITIKNVCLQQNMTSTTTQFQYFGLIGYNQGNTSILNVSVLFAVQGALFSDTGIIGRQYLGSSYAEVVNLRTSVNISSSGSGTGIFVGILFGAEEAKNCSVLNTNIIGGNINSGSTQNIGGFFGHLCQNGTIMNSSIQHTNISGSSNIGGYIGECNGYLYLQNSVIQQVHLSASNVGIVVGYFLSNGFVYFTSSSSILIYTNEVLQIDCTVLSNSLSGC